jgi:hypothetical protein
MLQAKLTLQAAVVKAQLQRPQDITLVTAIPQITNTNPTPSKAQKQIDCPCANKNRTKKPMFYACMHTHSIQLLSMNTLKSGTGTRKHFCTNCTNNDHFHCAVQHTLH